MSEESMVAEKIQVNRYSYQKGSKKLEDPIIVFPQRYQAFFNSTYVEKSHSHVIEDIKNI